LKGEVANAMAKKSKRGRASKWETHVLPNLDRIPKWRRQGMTEEQICKKLDVSVSTFNVYKNKYVELMEALKKGKEELIEELQDSLYKRALGYEYEEIKEFIEKDEKGNSKVKREIYKKIMHPDVGAIAFALKNLDKDNWKDNPHKAELDALRFEHEKILDDKKYW
jgi:transcriptional regulator with XRE-family HTH domain